METALPFTKGCLRLPVAGVSIIWVPEFKACAVPPGTLIALEVKKKSMGQRGKTQLQKRKIIEGGICFKDYAGLELSVRGSTRGG